MSQFSIDDDSFTKLMDAVADFSGNASEVINTQIHESGPLIYEQINPLINPSGRTFKGHMASATRSDWPTYITNQALEVTVRARGKWGYLYFPDDGTNTKRHAGEQGFMLKGAENAADEIIERCLSALTQEWED